MPELKQDQLDHLRKLLDAREKELRDDVSREVEKKDAFLDVASEVGDPGDKSFADLTTDLSNAEIGRDVQEMHAINAARERMDDGSYGECTDCGKDIPYERLEVQPMAIRCMPCQEMHEKMHAGAGRGATL